MVYTDVFTINHETKAIFGIGSHCKIGDALKSLGCNKVIVVYDAVMENLRINRKIIDAITKAGIDTIEYGDVNSEPTSDKLNEIANKARSGKVDGVVGLGGGSSIDLAKGVGLLISNSGSIENYIGTNRGKTPIVRKYPVVSLPTTSGTSAEVTPVFVVSESSTGKKTGAVYRSNIAIIDPSFMLSVPAHVTAYTGLDMLAHATESFTNTNPNWMSDLMNEKAIPLIFKYLPDAVNNGEDIEARSKLAFACMVVGYAFADKGTHIGHAIADKISNKYHYPHGVGCAMSLSVAIRYAALICPDKLRRIAKSLELAISEKDCDETIGQYVIKAYSELRNKVKMKSLKETGVSEQVIKDIIRQLPKDVRFKRNPHKIDFKKAADALWEEYRLG